MVKRKNMKIILCDFEYDYVTGEPIFNSCIGMEDNVFIEYYIKLYGRNEDTDKMRKTLKCLSKDELELEKRKTTYHDGILDKHYERKVEPMSEKEYEFIKREFDEGVSEGLYTKDEIDRIIKWLNREKSKINSHYL